MSEFHHISWLTKKFGQPYGQIIRSIGDDCAVIDRGGFYELMTTDMLVDGDHFCSDWNTPEQIGRKAMEVNISDIAAMGGVPEYAVISLCLTGKEGKDFLKKLYKGIAMSCRNEAMPRSYSIQIIGGDITKGPNLVINVAMIGRVEKERCVFRSGARVGDLIGVTGSLGGSFAGLEYLRRYGLPFVETRQETCQRHVSTKILNYCLNKYFEPKARFLAGRILSKYATAMIDVSDGLGSEVRHICEESGVGGVVYEDKISIRPEVFGMAEFLKKSECVGTRRRLVPTETLPLKWALSGGEDFELVFTIGPDQEKKLRREFGDFTIVGKVIELKAQSLKLKAGECWLVLGDGKKVGLPGGYEHEV